MLNVTNQWWLAVIVSGIGGFVGGLIYELLQARSPEPTSTGQVERPRAGGPLFWDLGFVASLIVGAAAAVAFCAFNPATVVTTTVKDVTSTVRQYDAIRLVAISLIVGSAGSSFFASMQEKVKAAILTERLGAVHDFNLARASSGLVPEVSSHEEAESVRLNGLAVALSSRTPIDPEAQQALVEETRATLLEWKRTHHQVPRRSAVTPEDPESP